MMDSVAPVSAIVLHHPEAKYFATESFDTVPEKPGTGSG